jgi:hypothetical protein
MRGVIIFISELILFSSCIPESKDKHLIYQNIVILSDLSSRAKNQRFPQKDTNEIHKIVEFFKSECVKPGEKIGDRSSITFSAFSEKIAVSIDLEKYKELGDKQSFINSTNQYTNSGLANKLAAFEDTIKSLYARITNPGLDLISMLMEKIENEDIVKQNKVITDGIDTSFINFENHIYIFTDGYLEYLLSKNRQNSQFFFGVPEIEAVRRYCQNNHVVVTTALQIDNSLSLPVCRNNKNQYINLHIYETHERDKDIKFLTYRNNKGLRDNEILEVVWRKWAKESGFKSFEWKKY